MSISRREFVIGGAIGAVATSSGASASGEGKSRLPNVLWFVSEDNGPLIGAYGDKLARTPTIDHLAARGILFEHAYCASPVCGPSRFAIISGMYPQAAGSAEDFGSTDEVLPRPIQGFPAYLRRAGYYCTNNPKKNYNSQLDFVDMWDESGTKAHWRNRPVDMPFFAIFNTFTTHESALFKPLTGAVKPGDIVVPPYLPDTPGVRQDYATFYNAMEKMDGELAARLAELDQAGVAEDTIVFYYSDNGGITPRDKRYCFDSGLRCPLIIFIPPKWAHLAPHPPGTRVIEPVSFVDLAPTMLSLAGIEVPRHIQGRSLLGRYTRKKTPRKIFGGRNRMDERYDLMRTLTDSRFRYIRNYSPHRVYGQYVSFMFQARSYQDWQAAHLSGALNEVQDRFWRAKPYEELYDLRADPHQVDNLVDRTSARPQLLEMRDAMDDHMLAINDNGLIPEGLPLQGYVASRLPGAYPLRRIMALAELAAKADVHSLPEFLTALNDDHEVIRYWGAQGLLILGSRSGEAVPQLREALAREQSVAVRISLSESLVNLSDDRSALRQLGLILDQEDDGPFRLQAINALTYIGERARPVLPAIRRSAQEDHRHVRSAAAYLIQVLEGTFSPHTPVAKAGGYIPTDPEVDGGPEERYYD